MIYVVRHGQTDWNKDRKMQGRMELPLNDYGIEQAKALKEKLQKVKFDFVFFFPTRKSWTNSRDYYRSTSCIG